MLIEKRRISSLKTFVISLHTIRDLFIMLCFNQYIFCLLALYNSLFSNKNDYNLALEEYPILISQLIICFIDNRYFYSLY